MAKIITYKRKSYAIIDDADGNLILPIKAYNKYRLAYRKLKGGKR